MREIQLTQGRVAIVDDEDYDRVSQFTWHFHPRGYAVRETCSEGVLGHIYMHRMIMGEPVGMMVDHRSGNGLDNQKQNLRLATNSQNLCNRGKQSNNTSGHKGVRWHKRTGKWLAQIGHRGANCYLGIFDDKAKAIEAYAKAAIELHGEFARTE